jgi:hypothetical protein
MKNRILRIGVVSFGLLLAAAVAHANGTLPEWLPGTTVVAGAGPQSSPTDITAATLESNSATVTVEGDTVTFMNGSMTMMGMWEWTWTSITLDRDPFVSYVGGFTNLSGMAQDFVFSTTTPISPALPSPTLYGGSTNVTYVDPDLSGGSLTIDSSSNPAYTGEIDGTGYLNMLAALNLTVSPSSASEFQGLPGPTIPGPAANSTIGIRHRFNLSAGDQATWNSTFTVIPEPGTIGLLAAGLAGLVLFGRRRQT